MIAPGCLAAGCIGKTGIGVFREGDLLFEHAGFDHEIAYQIEVGLARRELAVDDAIQRFGERLPEERGFLIVVEATDKVGGVFALGAALVEPETGARDAID